MKTKKEDKPFEDMLAITFKDMKNIRQDVAFNILENVTKSKLISHFPSGNLVKRGVTYPILFHKFKGGDWDHKVPAKKVVDQYCHNENKNSEGKPSAIFGNKILEF